jgi:thermitase
MINNVKKYPDQIEKNGFVLKKSQNEFLVQLNRKLPGLAVQDFFEKMKDVIEVKNSKVTDQKSSMIKDFNNSSQYSKWITRVETESETTEELMQKIENDNEVNFVAPIYFREDLNHPNAFTFINQIIIRFTEKIKKEDLRVVFQELGAEEVGGRRGELGEGLILLQIPNLKMHNCYGIAQKLAKLDFISYADVDWIQLHSGLHFIPNDEYFKLQWNLRNDGQRMSNGDSGTPGCDINVEQAWNITHGSPLVVIAILDSGCDLTHPDLVDNYVQSKRWYNSINGSTDPIDDYGHGTLVAGIAAARGNNIKGLSGVCPYCRIMPIKNYYINGMECESGLFYLPTFNHLSQSEIINALDHAIKNHVNIINISWGWDLDEDVNGIITGKLDECHNNPNRIVIVASAGNGNNNRIGFPASHKNVMAVGASDENDFRWYGSNWGNKLSVVAPGSMNLWSTDIQGLKTTTDPSKIEWYKNGWNDAMGPDIDVTGNYHSKFGGTSGAAPHVAGLAGLILSYNPTLSPDQVSDIIEKNARVLPLENGNNKTGFGRIDAYKAIQDVTTNHQFPPPNSQADVYIRDSLTDNGTQPYLDEPLCFSPDIIVRKKAVLNPQTDFADMTIDPGSDRVEIGNDNYIYIRVSNGGTIDTNIHARVYYAPLTVSCSPDQWKYIGQIDFYNVLAGKSAVSEALVWNNVPDPGVVDHFCLIASIEGFGDPHPDPAEINATSYADFIRKYNNICYRNVVFEDVLPNTTVLVNFVLGTFVWAKKSDLRIKRKELADRVAINLNLPKYMVPSEPINLENIFRHEKDMSKYMLTFVLQEESKTSTMKDLMIPPGISDVAKLEIKIPSDAKPGESYEINVEQLLENKVVGDFLFVGKVIDPKQAKFIAIRGSHFVHKADCNGLAKTDNNLWTPFATLVDARAAGYDLAIDCLNQEFTSMQVSRTLAKKVLDFVNKIELAEDLNQTVKDTLGVGYFVRRCGELGEKNSEYGLGIDAARRILEARDKNCRFKDLAEIETINGVEINKFIDLVNSIKAKSLG